MKVTKETVFRVHYGDLDRSITAFLLQNGVEVPGGCYESIDQNYWGNDESHRFNVVASLGEGEEEIIEKRNFNSLTTATILDWMCSEGVIEAGEYIVDVSW